MINLCIKNLNEISIFLNQRKKTNNVTKLEKYFYRMDLSDKETRILSSVFASLSKKR